MDKRIKRLEGRVLWQRPPSAEEMESARQKIRETIERIEEKCEAEAAEGDYNRLHAYEDLKRHIREKAGH